MSDSKLVIVTGPGRSGTSMTAGMLAAAGFSTGPDFPPDDTNRHGFFEDRNIVNYHERLLHGDDCLREYAGYIAGRLAEARLVCIKDPRFTEPDIWSLVAPVLPRPRYLVLCDRNEADIQQSYIKAYGGTRQNAHNVWSRRNHTMVGIRQSEQALLDVQFEDALALPRLQALRIISFLDIDPSRIDAMVDHVKINR